LGPVILVYFLLNTPIHKIFDSLRALTWTPFLLALALYPVVVVMKAWRWNLLMRRLGLEPPRLAESIRFYMIGAFLGTSTPGQAGDFVKAWYIRARGEPLAPVLFSIVLDRLFDFLIMALLSLLGLITLLAIFPRQFQSTIQLSVIWFAVAIALAIPALMARRPREKMLSIAIALAPNRARAPLDRWRQQFASLEMDAGLMGQLLLATAGSTIATVVRLWLLFLALTITIPLTAVVAGSALVAILQTLPISISGIGVRDAILVLILGKYGYTPDRALALSALFLVLNIENFLLGFLVSLRHPLASAMSAEGERLTMVPDHGRRTNAPGA
jgi:uncharacterized protein (TIRG00374 family)